jgi:hypothetical protein
MLYHVVKVLLTVSPFRLFLPPQPSVSSQSVDFNRPLFSYSYELLSRNSFFSTTIRIARGRGVCTSTSTVDCEPRHKSFIYRFYADSACKSFIYRIYAKHPGVWGRRGDESLG